MATDVKPPLTSDVKPPTIVVIVSELAEFALLLQVVHALLLSENASLFPEILAAKTTKPEDLGYQSLDLPRSHIRSSCNFRSQ